MNPAQNCEVLVIGGGPAGLTAAIYLARFRRNVVVVDAGQSRAAWIPKSHNYPGFFNGINGNDFLERMRLQASQFGALLVQGKVVTLQKDDQAFRATLDSGAILTAPVAILATGIVDIKPSLPHMPEFVYKGQVRFCPICDAYEAIDQAIAVIGDVKDIVSKALFLRTYSSNIILLPLGESFSLSNDDKISLTQAGIPLPKAHVTDLIGEADRIHAIDAQGSRIDFEVLYPAMGANVRSELALELGAAATSKDYIHSDASQQTSVENLYAIGDITTDLHQISVATGQAAIAACASHNRLTHNFCKP